MAAVSSARADARSSSTSPSTAGATAVAGKYELLRRIGSGGMGEVWLGKHSVTGTVSAVKILHPAVAVRERAERLFARERRVISRLAHPHIVPLHETGDGYIATAYVDGADLSRRMQTPLDPRIAIHYALQIASALDHAHALGVVHRDVKPSNILVDRRGNSYLADFGLAALVREESAWERAGTPAYMAPEQARGRAEPASDQFALARTLHCLLAGVTGPSETGPVGTLPASIPGAVVAVLRRAMSLDPAARFPSIADFADALADARLQLDRAEAPMRLAPESRVRAPFAWAAGAVTTRRVTREIGASDYRLSDLVAKGIVPQDAATELRARTGYEELAWTMYAHEGRLGPAASDAALARASDLVVFLHGLCRTRADWHEAAVAVCRDNAQAIVLVPDLFGCGESRLAAKRLAAEKATIAGTMTGTLAWLDFLNVRDLPTVLCGHSYSGSALLAATDEELGERVSRLAITPGIEGARTLAQEITAPILAVLALLTPTWLRFAFVAWMRRTPSFARLVEADFAQLAYEFARTPRWLLAKFFRESRRAVIAPAGSLRRCTVMVGEDDEPFAARRIEPFLVARGVPPEFIHRMVDCGHYPMLEQKDVPEARARNIGQIVTCVDVMLTASREGAPRSTVLESTIVEAG